MLEVMVALTLSGMIIIGIYEILQNARYHYRYTQGMITLQENGQLLHYILRQQISQAGYMGCRKLDENFSLKNAELTSNDAIHGYSSNTIKQYSSKIANKVVLQTDAILIRAMATNTTTLSQTVENGSKVILGNDMLNLNVGDKILIADCEHAEINTISKKQQTTLINVAYPLSMYPPGTQLGKFIEEVFYIGHTTRRNAAGNSINALFIHHENGTDEELLENVDNLQIQYGEEYSGKQLSFKKASDISIWNSVKAIKVTALLDSGDAILTTPQSVHYNGATYLAADRRLYKEIVVWINLPNR